MQEDLEAALNEKYGIPSLVETPYVKLDPVADVAVGEPLVVTWQSNRQEGYVIVVTCKGPVELEPCTPRIENGTFEVTFFIDTLKSALSGVRTRLSTPIHIWAGTSGSPNKGFILETMAQECPPLVFPRTKSSLLNVKAYVASDKRQRGSSPLEVVISKSFLSRPNRAWFSHSTF